MQLLSKRVFEIQIYRYKEIKNNGRFKTNTFIDKINLNLADIFIAECSRAVVDLNRSRQSLDSTMFNTTIKTIPNEEILLIKSGSELYLQNVIHKIF